MFFMFDLDFIEVLCVGTMLWVVECNEGFVIVVLYINNDNFSFFFVFLYAKKVHCTTLII